LSGGGSYDHEQHKQQFGERLRKLRADAGLSQMALARRLGGRTDVSQISRWERGLQFPELPKLVELAEAFDVSPKWLQWGDD
jgi:transcriptional regulator with XRE-family HTH domain